MRNIICVCSVLTTFILTTSTLPIGMQKYLSGNKYQVVYGPKEFVSKYNKGGDGDIVNIPLENDSSEYVIYGKLYVLKKNHSITPRSQTNENNVVLPNYENKHYRLRYPFHQPTRYENDNSDSILFPKEDSDVKKEYKRYDTGSIETAYSQRFSDLIMGTETDTPIPPVTTKNRNEVVLENTEVTSKFETTTEKMPMVDQEQATPEITFTLKSGRNRDNEEAQLGVVSIQDLEKWAASYTSTTEEPEESETTTNQMDLSFQSLFIVPSLKNSSGCPQGQRKNHAGVCVTPYVHRGNSAVTTTKSPTPTTFKSSLTSLMESLRAVEVQALQTLLGSQSTTTETSVFEIKNRNDFPSRRNGKYYPKFTEITNIYRGSLLNPVLRDRSYRNSQLRIDPTKSRNTAESKEKSILEVMQEFGRLNNWDLAKNNPS